MNNHYQIGDRLRFIRGLEDLRIHKGDTATIVAWHSIGWCVRFDRKVPGHNCERPDVIPDNNGWWLLDTILDQCAIVVAPAEQQIDISSLKLEDVL